MNDSKQQQQAEPDPEPPYRSAAWYEWRDRQRGRIYASLTPAERRDPALNPFHPLYLDPLRQVSLEDLEARDQLRSRRRR